MLLNVRRVWVIQLRQSGEFLTPNLFWAKSLKRAGRLFDAQEAFDTASANCSGDDFDLIPFFYEEK